MVHGSSPHSTGRRWLVGITILLGIVTVVLGAVGMYADRGFAEELESDSSFVFWIKLLFAAAALLTLEQSSDSPANVWYGAALLAALGFALFATSTIVLTLSYALREGAGRLWISLLSDLRPHRRHAVVIGLGRIGTQLVRDLRPMGKQVIALELQPDNPNVREARRLRALVLSGDGGEEELRRRARLERAGEIFIACGDDTLNIDLAGKIAGDFSSRVPKPSYFSHLTPSGRRSSEVRCHVHIGGPQVSQLIQTQNLLQRERKSVDFDVFNVRDNAARDLLLDPDHGLARKYAPSRDEVAHYFLFGFGEMGQTVALHMARLAHFENCLRLRLSIVDDFGQNPSVGKSRDRFLSRHPGFCPETTFRLVSEARPAAANQDSWSYRGARPQNSDWLSSDPRAVEYAVNGEFLDMPTEVDASTLIARLADRLALGQSPRVKAGVVVCFDEERLNLLAALRLRDAFNRLRESSPIEVPLPIYLYLPGEGGTSLILESELGANDPFPIHVFGRIADSAAYELVAHPVLREVALQVYRAYREVGVVSVDGPEDDQVPSLEIDQRLDEMEPGALRPVARYFEKYDKASNEDAAAHSVIKLDTVGYQEMEWKGEKVEGKPPRFVLAGKQSLTLAKMEHNRFMGERLVSGWRFGPHSNERKMRESLVPWEKLDSAENRKDYSQLQAMIRGYNAVGRVVKRRENQAPGSTGPASGGTIR